MFSCAMRWGRERMVTALEPQKPMAAKRLLLGWSDQMGVMDMALISPDVAPVANVRDLDRLQMNEVKRKKNSIFGEKLPTYGP